MSRFQKAIDKLKAPGFADLPLMERAETYRDAKTGKAPLTNGDIGRLVGTSAQNVEQLLVVASASAPVRGMLERKEVTYAMVIDAIRIERKGGATAEATLRQAVAKAKSEGRNKAKRGDIVAPGALPGRKRLIMMLRDLEPLHVALKVEISGGRAGEAISLSYAHGQMLLSFLDALSTGTAGAESSASPASGI